MNMFSNIKNYFSKDTTENVETKAAENVDLTVQNVPPSFLYNAMFGNGIVTVQQAFRYYRDNAAVAIAVDEIAGAVEEIKPILKIDGELITDHEIINLIMNPNGFDDYKQFMGNVIRYYLLTHNSYLLALGNYKFPPLELYPIKPTNISIYPNVDSYPDQYYMSNTVSDGQYRREVERGKLTKFINESGLSELYHIMGFSSAGDNSQGDSPLTAILGDIQQIIKGVEHNTALLSNSANVSLLINFKDNPHEDELRDRRQNMYETITGPENTGKMMVTGSDGEKGGIDVTDMTMNNRDMDYPKLNEYANLNVYKRYGIPLPLVTNTAATFSNFKNAILYFYEKAVIPNINTIFGGMTKFLVSKYKDLDNTDAIITFNPNEIPALMTKKLEEIKTRKDINIESANELRSMLPDREDVDGGDSIYINGSLRAIDEEEPELVTEDTIRKDLGIEKKPEEE